MKSLALIGAGYWGKNLARNFNQLGALRLICDKSPQILASYGPEYQGVDRVQSLREVLAHPEIDRVAIATPATTHYDFVKRCLEANKDVFVEKPICLDVAEAEELVRLAEDQGRILMVGHLLQYHPCIEKIRELLADGTLGKLIYITSNRLNLGKIRQEENALWSFAPHDISVILSLVQGRLPDQVICTGHASLTAGVHDTTLTALSFGEFKAHVYVSWLNPFKEQKLTVVGSNGMVVFDDTRPWSEKLSLYLDQLTWTNGTTPQSKKCLPEMVLVPEIEPLREECIHFLESCRNRHRPRTEGAEGVRVLRVLAAAQKSLESNGLPVSPLNVSNGPALDRPFFAHETAVIDPGSRIGDETKIWHFCHIMAGADIGPDCNLGQNVVVSPGVKIGRNVKVQNNVSIYSGTEIEDDVFLGPSCVLTNVTNPRSEINRRNLYEKTLIRRGATIGANATIVCGVTLGRFCFVAAGAVVTRDVPDYALVVGSPARQKGWMSRHGHPLAFGPDGIATCRESGLRYQLNPDGVVRCLDVPEDHPLAPELLLGRLTYDSFKSP